MTVLRAWWSRCRSALGVPGACGLLAAIASIVVYGVLVQQRQAELETLKASVPAPSSTAAAPQATPAQRAAAFQAQFPQADTLTDWLERMEAASARTGVVVERTDYRVSSEAPAGLARYQIALPVKGSYAQVRAFIAALLDAAPTLAVTDVDLKRDSIAANTLDARLNVSVYLRGQQR
jgi:Tfp pilus assembly protein PilO